MKVGINRFPLNRSERHAEQTWLKPRTGSTKRTNRMTVPTPMREKRIASPASGAGSRRGHAKKS